MNEVVVLTTIAIPGLAPEILGNYLASLGLMRSTARRWPNVRAAWNGGVFHLVGGPTSLDAVLDHACELAANERWTPYTHEWAAAQKQSTKAKSGLALALWFKDVDEAQIEMFSAHAVPISKVNFNPLLGTGGNSANRDFSDGWKRAIKALSSAKRKKGASDKRAELKAFLLGETVTWQLKKLNAASWFSEANKIYNSGQTPFRDGALSPWAMVLACEGLPFFAGSASRRLGARARAAGAFPFVTYWQAPQTAGEAGRDEGELWAPLWKRPMTVREAATLFSRGRAEIGGRGALTPSAFAVAVIRRGVDAGVTEFRRFVLGHTTSTNTFESRFEGSLTVQDREVASMIPVATSLERILELVQQLPRDEKKGKRWRFVGLRGPVEAALVNVAAEPLDTEAACSLLDAVVFALDRIDRNRAFRERRVAWEPLPLDWLPSLFPDAAGVELRLALACVSSFPVERPFAMYRFGVEREWRRFVHVENAPARWVWRSGPITAVLCDVFGRRIFDWEKAPEEKSQMDEPVRLQVPANGGHIERWLAAAVDENLLAQWMSRLALFDWRFVPRAVRSLATSGTSANRATAPFCLFGLFQPMFDLRPVRVRGGVEDLLSRESGTRTPAVARQIFSLLHTGQVDAATRIAASRYSMARAPLIRTAIPWALSDPDRLLASLLFTVCNRDRTALVERWLRPRRKEGDQTHA